MKAKRLLEPCTAIGLKMAYKRLPMKDPRTVARDIPGISDMLFPQLTVGIIAHFNKMVVSLPNIEAVPYELVKTSTLKPAMLFEIGFARGEQLVNGMAKADWDDCLEVATSRQRRHFNSKPPGSLMATDMAVADWVGHNLADMLSQLNSVGPGKKLVLSPQIAGYQWIASGAGDFSIGTRLIEVKCTNKRFISADYRQILT